MFQSFSQIFSRWINQNIEHLYLAQEENT